MFFLSDTAIMYDNEQEIGEALKVLLPKHQLQREDIFITTKLCMPYQKSQNNIENLVKRSLKYLQTDYIDLYLIHWPGVSGLDVKHPDNLKYRIDTWKKLSQLHKDGFIRSIGVSNYMVNHLTEMLDYCDGILPAVNQVEWHPYNQIPELLQFCRKHNIFLQAYSSLGTSSDTTLRSDPVVAEIANKLGKSPSQILLRWSYQQDIGIIPKARSKKHIDENIDLDFEIPANDLEIISNIQKKMRYDENPEDVF